MATKTRVPEQSQCGGRITSTLSKPSVSDSLSRLNFFYSFWYNNNELTLVAGIDVELAQLVLYLGSHAIKKQP